MANRKLPPEAILLTDKNLQNIGSILWDLRTSSNITQDHVAQKLGKKQSYISHIESTEKPKIPHLPNLVPYLSAVNHQLVIIPKGVRIIFEESAE